MRCRWLLVVMSIGLACQVGCNDPAARKQTAHRQRKIQYCLGHAAARERAASAKVNAGLREATRLWNEDAARTRQNRRELAAWISEKQQRWNRRAPLYQAEIDRRLAGKPDHARRTAIDMFY